MPAIPTSDAYLTAAYGSLSSWVDVTGRADAEPTDLVRFFRWHLILNNLDTLRERLLGLGSSFAGHSVDA